MKASLFLILFLKVAWSNVLSPGSESQHVVGWRDPIKSEVDLTNDMWEEDHNVVLERVRRETEEKEMQKDEEDEEEKGATKEEVNTIETYVVVDYVAYQKHLLVSNNNSTKALESIRFYIDNVMQTVDNIYINMANPDHKFRVSVLGVNIHTSSKQSPFTTTSKRFDFFDSFKRVKNWAKKKERNFPKNDLITVFTGHFSETVSGVAMMNSVCRGGLVFVTMAGITIDSLITAHEIAHAMGVRHDEKKDGCLKSDLLMNPWVGQMPYESLGSNVWSNCSIKAFSNYVRELEGTKKNCLVQTSASAALRRVQGNLQRPGVRWSAQNQCTTRLGAKSFLCVSASENICHKLFCYHDEIMGCVSKPLTRAYEGTSCGHRKWCVGGRCVESDLAFPGKEECRYGDAKEGFRLGNEIWTCNKTLLTTEVLDLSSERVSKELVKVLKEVSIDMCDREEFKKNCCEKCKNKN